VKVTPVPGSQASPSPDGEPAGDGGIGDHVVPSREGDAGAGQPGEPVAGR